MESLVYTVREAAIRLGISEWLAYRMVKRGDIPHLRFGDRIVVPKVAVQRLCESAFDSQHGGAA